MISLHMANLLLILIGPWLVVGVLAVPALVQVRPATPRPTARRPVRRSVFTHHGVRTAVAW